MANYANSCHFMHNGVFGELVEWHRSRPHGLAKFEVEMVDDQEDVSISQATFDYLGRDLPRSPVSFERPGNLLGLMFGYVSKVAWWARGILGILNVWDHLYMI